jgi:hypothetical protein
MNSSLNVTAIVTEEVTAVEIKGVGIDGFYDPDHTATGWSKKHPTDQADPEIAYNLAMSRALQTLANSYARNAANLAGFPVVVELDALTENGKDVAVLVHTPVEYVDIEEKVSY